MKPKMLSDVELEAIVWASVKSSSSFVITDRSDARALVANTRSIGMQYRKLEMGYWRFDSNNQASTGRFLAFLYLMSSENQYLGYGI
ncbi:hypothetical protein Osc7112_6712 (plasmid) [Oscillatoria nigro-viridis PCC 7112]|uniref:Uncharacterized protein n=2 Tax=Phormidium nigroviride TaxID=482564 RepID=K9VUC3_9CYAN|nr:hypothetical protein Osc7112_6712 [Oscillatoria nigro-viridis PCC 7112]